MATLRVILTEEVPKLGEAGDVVTVKAGYGRNFLLPRGKAMLATDGRVRELEHQRRVIEEKERKGVASLQQLGSELGKVHMTFEVQASAEGKLFGSVTNADIAGRLKEQGFDIDRRKLGLKEPIKQLGDYEVSVRLHREVTCAVQVGVVSSGEPVATEQETTDTEPGGAPEDAVSDDPLA